MAPTRVEVEDVLPFQAWWPRGFSHALYRIPEVDAVTALAHAEAPLCPALVRVCVCVFVCVCLCLRLCGGGGVLRAALFTIGGARFTCCFARSLRTQRALRRPRGWWWRRSPRARRP
jgi:hypothetical protein